MKIRKFEASNMREALAQIKRELGPDAMVVATRQIRRGLLGVGVEVTAAIDSDPEDLPPAPAAGSQPVPSPGLTAADVERVVAPLRAELQSLRKLVRSRGDSRGNEALRAELIALREAIAGLGAARDEAAMPSIAELAATRKLAAPSRSRCVALVGPTGVGKTTTIAKLAGRDALMHDYDVALVTMDNYRVGGEDQMRIFADLIGAPLHKVSKPSQLEDVLELCEDCDRIYIDTAGRSPRDAAAIAELTAALRPLDDLEVHLTVAANMHPRVIDAALERYDQVGVDRLIVTKLDEAHDLAQLVTIPARLGKPIAYIATGQRIPEDIEHATQERLVELASGTQPVEVAA